MYISKKYIFSIFYLAILPSVVKDSHGDLESIANTSQHILNRDGTVVEVNLSGVGALE